MKYEEIRVERIETKIYRGWPNNLAYSSPQEFLLKSFHYRCELFHMLCPQTLLQSNWSFTLVIFQTKHDILHQPNIGTKRAFLHQVMLMSQTYILTNNLTNQTRVLHLAKLTNKTDNLIDNSTNQTKYVNALAHESNNNFSQDILHKI